MQAELAIKKINYDILIIDRMIPGIDGLSLVKKIRNDGNNTPVIFLSALNELENRLEGFEAGGDDYLAKPFSLGHHCDRVLILANAILQAQPQFFYASSTYESFWHNLVNIFDRHSI